MAQPTRSGHAASRTIMAGSPAAHLAVGLIMSLAMGPAASAGGLPWLFHAAGSDGAADYSGHGVDDTSWTPLELPDRDWLGRAGDAYTYGWYRYHFIPDPAFTGRDMVLKLGIIDDVDATYCNGSPIGQTGSFPPQTTTAYNVDREYIIPAQGLRYGADNVLAVKVYNIIGTGGLLGKPRLGYRLAGSDSWLVSSAGTDGQADRSDPALPDSAWDRAPMPDVEWDKRQPQDGVYGWYRLHFEAPGSWRERELVLDLGFCLDADRAFVNGRLIGASGSFPPEHRTAASRPRLYEVPPDALRYGADNVLAVQVYNDTARGGIWGRPAILAAEEAGPPAGRAIEHARRLRSAGRHAEAWQAIRGLWDQTTDAPWRAALLGELTALYEASGQDDDALAAFSQLSRDYREVSPPRDAVLAVCRIQGRRGALSDAASYMGEDRHTQGRWWLRYGVGAFVLCAAGGDCEVYGAPGAYSFSDAFGRRKPEGSEPLLYWATRADEAESLRMHWVAAVATNDPRAPWNPVIRDGTFAWWDDKGEEHPFDEAGPDLRISLTIPEGLWRLGVYQVDPDWGDTWHPRLHDLVLSDEEGSVLATADTGKFSQGAWQLFCVRGPLQATLRVCKGPSICAIVSALALDRLGGAPGLPVGSTEGAPGPSPWEDVRGAAEAYRDALASLDAADPLTREGADEVRGAWQGWHLALDLAAPDDRVEALFERFCGALAREEGDGGLADRLLACSSACFAQRRYRAAQMLDARWLTLWSRGEAPSGRPLDLAGRWLPVDDAFACTAFEAELERAAGLPGPEAADTIASLALPSASQGRALVPVVRSPSVHSIEGDPQLSALGRAVGIASFPQRAIDRLRGIPDAARSGLCHELAVKWCRSLLPAALGTPGGADSVLAELDRALQDSLGIADARADVLKSKVWVLSRAGRIDEAVKAADEFWGCEPTVPVLKGFVGTVLGEALARAGRYEEARASYRRALEACVGAEPQYADIARRALAELDRLSPMPG